MQEINAGAIRMFVGLSTEIKPENDAALPNGSKFIETDTGQEYTCVDGHWQNANKSELEKFSSLQNARYLEYPQALENYLSKVKTQNGIIDIGFYGDSITEGEESTSYTDGGYVGLLRQYFANKYGDVGFGFVPVHYPSGETEKYYTFTGTWVGESHGPAADSERTNTIGDTVEFDIDGYGFELFYTGTTIGGIVNIYVDDVLIDTLDTNESTIINALKYEITGLENSEHSIKLENATESFFFTGIRESKGSSGVRVNMCARFGTDIANAVTNKGISFNTLFAPDLAVIGYLANDYNSQTAIVDYMEDFQTWLDTLKGVNSDILILINGLRDTTSPTILQSEYENALRGLATKNNVAIMDINKAFGSTYDTANNLGIMEDTVHPNDAGHALYYQLLLPVLDA